MILIRPPRKSERKEMYELRWRILRKPFGLPRGSELDNKEHQSHCLIAIHKVSGKIVGTARLTHHQHKSKRKVAIINCVIVDPQYRRKGIGTLLLTRLHKMAKEQGYHAIVLDSRRKSEPFYRSLGYQPQGGYFQHRFNSSKSIVNRRMMLSLRSPKVILPQKSL